MLLPPDCLAQRSIPAPAGEPSDVGNPGDDRGVYPRACGGTGFRSPVQLNFQGLSPRLRGNRGCLKWDYKAVRSIPAPAGEPFPPGVLPKLPRVYPRACGGTREYRACWCGREGLSPRLRGNLDLLEDFGHGLGSIPAPAGEPCGESPGPAGGPVYPRACGGTASTSRSRLPITGLSPRLRGNQVAPAKGRSRCGSIPAPAGEPRTPVPGPAPPPVYPRACGGTGVNYALNTNQEGLSPRLRGNLRTTHAGLTCDGSIPAPAGEPCSLWSVKATTRVYPRACGGTTA